GSGNDFILIDNRQYLLDGESIRNFVQAVCRRRFSVGADGLILIEPSQKADFKWRFYNADGGEVEMCGNGGRCVARLANLLGVAPANMSFETIAGLIKAEVVGERVKLKMTDPSSPGPWEDLEVGPHQIRFSFINTGVPHAVIFVENLEQADVFNLGRQIRYHPRFQPAGTNINFVKTCGPANISVRTYERGVEDETLACGTGDVASAIICNYHGLAQPPVSVLTKSGETLIIHFRREGSTYLDVYLEGDARLTYQGAMTEEAFT
ncbi:MAG: diaminopimelate epimerase, partial [Candidatus Tectomicrobia bacterium]|nr:diaminopimelate epimerase [Candidatus Tectomicrobia bacterium]